MAGTKHDPENWVAGFPNRSRSKEKQMPASDSNRTDQASGFTGRAAWAVLVRPATGAVLEGGIMSRVTFVALATFLTIGSTSAAFACCGGPAYYAPTACGGCAPPAPVVYVPAPPPPPPPPVQVAPPAWSGGCGCGRPVVYAAPPVEVTPVAPAPIYVVNQGPEYSGPGIMVPYHTYSPAAAWAPANGYPYVPRAWLRLSLSPTVAALRLSRARIHARVSPRSGVALAVLFAPAQCARINKKANKQNQQRLKARSARAFFLLSRRRRGPGRPAPGRAWRYRAPARPHWTR